MSFDIRIDYRFDSSGFFDPTTADGAAARAALERAVEIWEDVLLDEFDDVPAGIAFEIDDPSAAGTDRRVVLDEAIDDLLIFVGAETLGGPLAIGGFDGTGDGGIGLGDALSSRIAGDFRDQGPVTDFEPWAGTVAYDPTVDWSFDLDVADPERPDFISVSLHEIGHVLGFGTAAIFDRLGGIGTPSEGQFMGPNAMAANGGEPVPLQVGLGHVVEGFGMNQVLMDPSLTRGNRLVPSEIDKAILADIGWEIAGFEAQGETPAIATQGSETIFGTIVGDALDGLGGADTVQGRGGDDRLSGGAGDDAVLGGDGDDTVTGGTGDDQVQGGAGDDLLLAGRGDDTLFGQEGTDTFRITGGGGAIRISGMDLDAERIEIENSGFVSDAFALAAVGKPFGNVSRLTFADGTQIDVFHDSQQGTPLTAANLAVLDPAPVVSGDGGDDSLIGTAEVELLEGLGGADTLIGGAGADGIDGGAGIDRWAPVEDAAAGVSVLLDEGRAIDSFGDTDTLVSVEEARGTAFGDTLVGDDADNRLFGRGGDDRLDAGEGADTLFAGDGADTLTGGAGDDQLQGGAGGDALSGDGGGDLLFGQDGADTLMGGAGDDELQGGAGGDELRGEAGADTLFGEEDDDALFGGEGADLLLGGAGDDRLSGGTGADTLSGDAGADRLEGGAGDDVYVLDGADRVVEAAGAGRDVVFSGAAVVLRDAEIEVVTLTGDADARVTGNATASAITGNSGANVLIGGGGADTLEGGAGADVFAFQQGDLGGGARILDLEAGDRIALDDRLFGLGDGGIDVRDVTQAQVRGAIANERALYDGRTGTLSVDRDGRGADAPELLVVIEGGGRIGAEDLLLF